MLPQRPTRNRQLSQRVIELVSFVSERPMKSWLERRREWHRAHPEWRYGSDQSIAVVYCRAKRKLAQKKQLGN